MSSHRAIQVGPLHRVADARRRTASPLRSTPARAAERPTSPAPRRRGPWQRLASALLTLLLVVTAVLFLLLAVGPHVLGYRTSTMLTGSMEPGISPGDVVVTVPAPADRVAVGDVISYHIPVEDHRVETHRVTWVKHTADGQVLVRTKGDANANVDPWTAVLDGDTVWEQRAVIPELGNVIRALRTPFVRTAVLWTAIVGVVGLGLTTIWGRDDEDERSAS